MLEPPHLPLRLRGSTSERCACSELRPCRLGDGDSLVTFSLCTGEAAIVPGEAAHRVASSLTLAEGEASNRKAPGRNTGKNKT